MKSFTQILAAAAALAFGGALAAAAAQNASTPSLLIFTKTAGYRHPSIVHGIGMVRSIADQKGWSVTATEDSSVFLQNETLSAFTALVFISTTGNFLNASELAGLHDYVYNGGGWLGIHAAGDFGDNMPVWYHKLVGAQFRSHPCELASEQTDAQIAKYGNYSTGNCNIRQDTITIQDHTHPSTADLPATFTRVDEFYSYFSNVHDDAPTYTVLLTLNETYIDDITPNAALLRMPSHPISWYSVFNAVDGGSGRAFYTGMGHTNDSYHDPPFITHVTGGLEWVTGTAV